MPIEVYQRLLLLPGWRAGKSGAKERPPVRPVDEERAFAIVPHVSAQVGAMIKVQLYTGMRSTEICIMRPRDIDRTLTPWVYRRMFHKTQAHGIAREIPIGHQAREVLAQYLEGRDPDSFIFSPAEADQERRRRQREKRDDVPPSQVERSRRAAKCRHTRRRPPRSRYTRTS